MLKILTIIAIVLAFAAGFSPVFAGDCPIGCGTFKSKYYAAPPVESKCSGRPAAGPSPSCAPYYG